MSRATNYWSDQPVRARGSAPRGQSRRWLLDGVGVVAALVLIGGAVLFFRTKQEREALIERTVAELRRVELEMNYRAAAKLPGLNEKGWPETIDESWFRGQQGVPRNPLLSSGRPWLDVAGQDEANLENPTLMMAADKRLAGFWYNPNLGIVRARVPVMVSDEEALEIYNRVNGTRLASIFGTAAKDDDDSTESSHAAEADGKDTSTIEITTTGQVRRRGAGEKH